jgi:serine/threonine protein kinase
MAVSTDIVPERYRNARQIGRGGMGEIYRATDVTLGRDVAIKILADRYADDYAIRQRFTREALTAARLSHERTAVTIYDVGEHLGRPYIVMEYLSGGSLDDVLRHEGAQPPQRVFTWLEQAGRALDAAHGEGVVHRDVKPANLLLDADGNVHVADFGIASAAGLDSLTITGTVLGTAGYLSPEQAQGDRATAASDRYALAVVAFELLTGQRPFQAESPTAEATSHVHASVPSICDRDGSLPCELDPVFEQALAKDPARRYETCAEFVAALRAALANAARSTRELPPIEAAATQRVAPAAEPTAPRPVSPRSLSRRRRNFWPALLALLLVVGALGGALAAYLLARGDTRGAATSAPPQPKVTTVLRTVTAEGKTTTVQKEVTTTPPATTNTSPPSTPPSTLGGHELNDQAYARIQAGDYAGALPMLEQAVKKLQGVGPADPAEGYANFNLGYALVQLGRCGEAIPYLELSQRLQPQRVPEPGRTLRRAQACA